jgi:hypothetical protein
MRRLKVYLHLNGLVEHRRSPTKAYRRLRSRGSLAEVVCGEKQPQTAHGLTAQAHDAVSAFNGRVKLNVAPWGAFAVAHSRPP